MIFSFFLRRSWSGTLDCVLLFCKINKFHANNIFLNMQFVIVL